MFRLAGTGKQQLKLLVTPSWLSGMIAVVVALALTAGAILIFAYSSGTVARQLQTWQQTQKVAVHHQAGTAVQSLSSSPSITDTWPLLLIWGLIGAVVYVITMILLHSLGSVKNIGVSLEYVHARPVSTLESAAGHFIMRVMALVIWVSLGYVFIKDVVPYSITAAHKSAADFLSVNGIGYCLASFAIIVLNLHLVAVFMRLSLGRARIFSEGM